MSETPQLSEARRALLEKYLGGNLPQEVRAASPITQEAEAKKIDHRGDVEAIQTGGFKRPFFYLHGEWRGAAFYCHPLAHALGSDQSFYALPPRTFEGLRIPPSLEVIARGHLEAIRSIQPEGPYFLGGWCNGALVAYEMARQLRAQGQSVDLLVLIDGIIPGRHRWVRHIISRLGGLIGLSQEKQLDLFLIVHCVYRYLRFPHYRRQINSERLGTSQQSEHGHRHGKAGSGLAWLTGLFTSAAVLRLDYSKMFEWVNAGYAPDLYAGKITFFWVSEAQQQLSAEWREVVKAKEGEVEILSIPGNDTTSRTEYLPVFAERLHACLKKAQTTTMN